jgi:hypothetical protein
MADKLYRYDAETDTCVEVGSIIVANVGLLFQPAYTHTWPVPPFDKPYETLNPADNVAVSYSYTNT